MRFSYFTILAGFLIQIVGQFCEASPNYQQSVLDTIYPAGAQRGTTLEVSFSAQQAGLKGADAVVIDGPPGITVKDFTSSDDGKTAKATFEIAADATPGRRYVRVKGGPIGLTNFRWFFVSTLPELVETEKNNTPESAEQLNLPIVVNGHINTTLDQDCYRFEAKQGQNIVAAVMSHWLGAMGYDRNTAGFSDTSLELLDDAGSVVAEAGDSLGYDPLIEYVIPRDGQYTIRISGMGYKGFPQMVYRLTIGEVPYVTSLFPSGGKRGESVEVEFSGPNVPAGSKRIIQVPDDDQPLQFISLDDENGSTHSLPFVHGEEAELSPPVDPADDRENAMPLNSFPVTINGRFDQPGDADWYRVELKKGTAYSVETMGQRHLRSPVDTLLEVYDANGLLLRANDDGEIFQSEVTHEFIPFDSYLTFTPKADGPYFVRVSEQSGAGGSRAIYRLIFKESLPDFDLHQWPDALAIFGPGSTSACVVEIHRYGGLKEDVELTVEGLPEGWVGSTTVAYNDEYRVPRTAFGHKVFLTITAPESVAVGEMISFRVVGKAKSGEREIIHTAQPLSHYHWSEPNRFNPSPVARAVIARPQGISLQTSIKELSAKPSTAIEVPIVAEGEPAVRGGQVSISPNKAGAHFRCSIGSPVKVVFKENKATVPVKLPASFKAGGTYYFVLADGWSSETRKGLPGPCTPLIKLTIAAD